VCQTQFAQSFILKRHMMIHTGERPYRCDVSDAVYYVWQSQGTHDDTYRCKASQM